MRSMIKITVTITIIMEIFIAPFNLIDDQIDFFIFAKFVLLSGHKCHNYDMVFYKPG